MVRTNLEQENPFVERWLPAIFHFARAQIIAAALISRTKAESELIYIFAGGLHWPHSKSPTRERERER